MSTTLARKVESRLTMIHKKEFPRPKSEPASCETSSTTNSNPTHPRLFFRARMTSTLPVPIQATYPPSKYRYSAVDDLQLPPALSVTTETPLDDALTMALEREYSQLTVISSHRKKLLGYLDVAAALQKMKSEMLLNEGLTVKDVYTKFDRRKSVGYTVITPDTSLDVLDEFLKDHDFAIGMASMEGTDLVTDEGRKFVLGIATRSDLDEFAKRRVY